MEQETLKKLRVLIPVDDLTPIQAQIDLALPPNRGLPNAMLEIDTNKLNQLNIQPILGPRRVQNTTTA
ncbi:MAG: hypothetical protein KC897_13890, partial [Candidatus Omnitrophica bacterium]|nr:hypothetical protein [Candidatus Omnitrophota bacterium]